MDTPRAWSRRRHTSRAAQRDVMLLEAQMRDTLRELDLRTWAVEVLRFHEWGRRREFELVQAASISLVETDPVAPPRQVDAGTLRITSRRLTFAGTSVVRTIELGRIVAWSRSSSALAVCAPHDERVWHLTGLSEAHALLAAVILNLADNVIDDDHPSLDLADPDDVAAYITAFEDAEVVPHRRDLSRVAQQIDTLQEAPASPPHGQR